MEFGSTLCPVRAGSARGRRVPPPRVVHARRGRRAVVARGCRKENVMRWFGKYTESESIEGGESQVRRGTAAGRQRQWRVRGALSRSTRMVLEQLEDRTLLATGYTGMPLWVEQG